MKYLNLTKVTNIAAVAALLAMTLGLTACGKDLKDVAKKASKELGVPITINAESTDVCARRQLAKMWDEYRDLSSDDQNNAKLLLKQHESLTVNSTQIVGKYTGESTLLYLGSSDTSKLLADRRKLDGTAPKTQVDRSKALAITTQGAVDESDKTIYVVQDKALFKLIDAEDSPVLKKALSSGEAQLRGKAYGPIIDCGELANVHELF